MCSLVPISVVYYDTEGNTLATVSQPVTTGSNVVRASADNVPEGYKLTGAALVTVTVDYKGNCTPAMAEFVYKAPDPVTVPIEIVYRDEDGEVLANLIVAMQELYAATENYYAN